MDGDEVPKELSTQEKAYKITETMKKYLPAELQASLTKMWIEQVQKDRSKRSYNKIAPLPSDRISRQTSLRDKRTAMAVKKPRTKVSQALKSENANKWLVAIKSEIGSLLYKTQSLGPEKKSL
jgi:hypothetical protein